MSVPPTATVPVVHATEPVGPPPPWAVLQRRLFDVMDVAWRAYEARYCADDGSLVYAGPLQSRDGADDFYEAFVGWPTLYQLGGSADLLDTSKWHWGAVTAQLTRLGFVVDEFERGYDWFHLGESMIFAYSICAADPDDAAFRERATRFAEHYLPGSPTANYDPATRTIRAAHNGAGGPRWGTNDEWLDFGTHLTGMRPFGLPIAGVPGIDTWDDLADPRKAALMGSEMARRLGTGDTAVNLAATSLATNAWLYGHDPRLREWGLEYLGAWAERAAHNDGIVPDNVGPSGVVGELHEGDWFGGNYGWAWPHGVYSVGQAVCVAAVNGLLLDGDPSRLESARTTLDRLYELGITASVDDTEMSIRDRWEAELGEDTATATLLVPNRRNRDGWFDHQPPQLGLPVWLWHMSLADEDRDRLTRLRERSGYDWRVVRDFRNKEDAGHEAPWLAYLAGDNPTYPEEILRVALSQVQRRLDLVTADTTDPADLNIHHWQRHNPVTTEALLQLATGTPQVLYNGGLLPTRLAYGDPDARRPGLPPDVAALVDAVEPGRTSVELVNLSPTHRRRVLVQAGGFGGDRIDAVTVTTGGVGHPGPSPAYAVHAGPVGRVTTAVGGERVEVVLPPGRRVHLDLHVTARATQPHHTSFQTADGRPMPHPDHEHTQETVS